MDSASSCSVILGSVIFLTITALPASDAATSFVRMFFDSNRRRIASATAAPSMMAPSTMLSGGTGSIPNAVTLNDLPEPLSSTALTALEPMSKPTTARDLPNTLDLAWPPHALHTVAPAGRVGRSLRPGPSARTVVAHVAQRLPPYGPDNEQGRCQSSSLRQNLAVLRARTRHTRLESRPARTPRHHESVRKTAKKRQRSRKSPVFSG